MLQLDFSQIEHPRECQQAQRVAHFASFDFPAQFPDGEFAYHDLLTAVEVDLIRADHVAGQPEMAVVVEKGRVGLDGAVWLSRAALRVSAEPS